MLQKLTQRLKAAKLKAVDTYKGVSEDVNDGRPWLKLVAIGFAVLMVVLIIWGWFKSQEPETFDVQQRISAYVKPEHVNVKGVATTVALLEVMEAMLDGYVSNDIFPPGVWLDNRANWEYGVLIQVRDLSKALREAYSRSQSQSREDKALMIADPLFNFDNSSWIMPNTEREYRSGMKQVQDYLNRLVDSDRHSAQFYARADNLNYWLSTVESRLGSLSQRLSASVGQRRLNIDLAGDNAAVQSTSVPGELEVKTPWLEIDDVFYEARGSAWALIHILRAVEIDFADVLQKKNAAVSIQQIVRELEATQESVFSPIILNGSGFGILANHSLVMGSYISRANAAIINLRELLAQG
ncbi:MAG TPA: DUF2333 family protein [Marinagarivorans sp.]